METSLAIIEELESGARALNLRMVSLPGEGGCDEARSELIERAMNDLGTFRAGLEELKKAFKEGT